jgi:hypothetical protein
MRLPSVEKVISTGSAARQRAVAARLRLTFVAWCQQRVLEDLGVLGDLADDAAVLLVHENHLPVPDPARAHGVRLSRLELGRVVLGRGFLRGGGALHERGALREDGLERVDVLLLRAAAQGRELDARVRRDAALRLRVPDQVAARSLGVDSRRGHQGEVDLRREVQVQIAVVFGRPGAGLARRHGDHEQRHGLRTGRREIGLLAILYVVRLDLLDGIEKVWIVGHSGSWGSGGFSWTAALGSRRGINNHLLRADRAQPSMS